MVFSNLLERETECSTALAALHQSLRGDGAAIAFEAPAGAGKTSLLRAVCTEAHARGARVLSARGLDLEAELRFGLAGQLFTPALASAVGHERKRLLEGPARVAGPVIGLAPASPPPALDTAVLHGLYWLCANLCERSPVVLAVDDAHWGDECSLRFLVHLTRRVAGLPLLLAVAAAPTERATQAREPLQALLHDDGMDLSHPRPLSPIACAAIVRRTLGDDATDALCDACHVASGGNPFLVEELAQALRDDGVDPRKEDATVVEDIGPQTVARSVLLRLSRIGADAVELARTVAICPDGVELRHAATLAGLEATAAARAADRLVAADVLAPGRTLAYARPMIRVAVYQDLPAASRALLHVRAAQLLRGDGADLRSVAAHLLTTDPGTDAHAFDDLIAAARAALGAGAAQAAWRFAERALAEPVAASMREAAAHVRTVAGALAGRDVSLASVHAVARADPALLRDLGRALAFGSKTAEAVSLLDGAVAAAAAADPELCARCVVDRSWLLWSSDDTLDRFADDIRAARVAAPRGTLLERATAASRSAWEAWRYEDAERTATLARRGLERDLLLTAGCDGLAPLSFAALALALADRPGEGLTALDAALVAQPCAADMALVYGHVAAASVRLYCGDLAAAQCRLSRAAELMRADFVGSESAAAITSMQAAIDLERRGCAAAAELLQGLAVTPTWAGLIVLAVRGHVKLAAGHPHEALDDLMAARRAAQSRGLKHPLYPIAWGGDVALAAAAIGDRELAREQAGRQLALARRFGALGSLGYALRVAGLVTGGEEGIVLLGEAASVLAQSSARLLYAESLADLGAALRRDNQRAAARAPLRLAIDLAGRCGAQRLLRRAPDEQLASGGRPRRMFVSGVESLTPSERRIARLAATGLTNREISQQLYVSIKTVEMHVGNALGKLQIRSRRQLCEVAGLMPEYATAVAP